MMSSINQWQPEDYDQKLGFVSEYGKEIVTLLNPQKNELILDLGCGTGDLTYEISRSGAKIHGVDASADMIRKAQDKYPSLHFDIADGQQFHTEVLYDAVFSNAALHWMKDANGVIQSVCHALRPGGRFVAEFGGKDNVKTIVDAMIDVLTEEYGIDAAARNPWYFPSIGEYCVLLERQGFTVRLAHYFNRPTKLQDGEQGLLSWLAQFGDDFFQGFTAGEISHICRIVSRRVNSKLWHDDAVYADYKRIRVIAEKPIHAT